MNHHNHNRTRSIQHWIEYHLNRLKVKGYSEQTVYHRTKTLRYFKNFCSEANITDIQEVTRATVLNYQNYLYQYRKRDGKPLTLGTQAERLQALNSFFGDLTKAGILLFNPAADIEYPKKGDRLPKAILNPEEVELVMNATDLSKPEGVRNRAILEVLYSTGIRRAEACNLTLGDVDYDRQLVMVRQGKGNRDRMVPIGERALIWLEKYITEARPNFQPEKGQQVVFLMSDGVPMEPNRLSETVHRIIDRAGINKSGSCHLLRHSCATAMHENGCDIRLIQELLGHKKLETTQIYTKVSLHALQQAHAKFHPAKMK
ncbi:MAG: site-specific tyrosine recombinase XerC [Bacteroidota bacterium]